MAPVRTRPAPGSARWTLLAALAAVLAMPPSHADTGVAPQVRLERTDGESWTGRLGGIDGGSLRIEIDGAARTVPVGEVRRLEWVDPAAGASAAEGVIVTTIDGGRLAGDDFAWTGDTAVVIRGASRCELPIGRVQMVAWRRSEAPAAEDAEQDPAWLAELPERPDSDYIAVGAEGEVECVACAITAVSEDTVTVVVDGDTIPVKRPRVAGLRWLRTAAAAGGIRVNVTGGRLSASEVTWTPEVLLVDGGIRLPAEWLREIDYASGRTSRLAELAPEKVDVEPFFGGLVQVEGLAAFFAPRVVRPPAAGGGAPAVVMRPRTVAVWRIPADSRRFRSSLATAAWGNSSASAIVGIAVDGREVFRRQIDGRPADSGVSAPVIDLDVTSARRLTVTVDFAGAGVGCPVRLNDPVFEK